MDFRFNRKDLIYVFLSGLIGIASAQDAANLEGLVADANTGLPLPGSHVYLTGTSNHAVADEVGRFRFYSLSPGRYELDVSHIGYGRERILGIVVTPQAPAFVEVRLRPQPVYLPEVQIQVEAAASQGIGSGGRVIGREELRKSTADDIARLLEMEGLATISSDGSPGGKRSVTLRGSGSDQVLVLVDGRPLNEAADGVADLSLISLAEVQQIEVYPQAPSSLGAQAIGGVINIVTLRPGLEQYYLRAGLSGYGEKFGGLTLGRSINGWPFLGVIEHRESTGEYRYRTVPDDGLDVFTRNLGMTFTRENADYRRDYLSLKIDPPGALNLGYRRTLLFRHNPDYLPEPIFEHESSTKDDRQEFTLNLDGGDVWYRPAVSMSAEGYHQKTMVDYGPQYPLLYSYTDLRGEAYQAELSWRKQTRHWDDVRIGSGIRLERLWSAKLQDGYAERLHEFGYLQVQGDLLKDMNLPLRSGLFSGVRADLYRDQETFVYPRVGLELGGGDDLFWLLRGELAGAYRLPSFNALFWQEDLLSSGNPNLKPERSQNQELHAGVGCQYLEIGISYFDRDIWDLIYWRLDFDNRWKPLNLSRAWIYGTEYSLKGSTGQGGFRSEVTFSHRWMRAINLSGEPNTHGNFLPYRPQNSTTLSFRQSLRYLTVDLSARWVDRRFTNESNTKSLSPYKVWDLGISKRLQLFNSDANLDLRAEIRNLFNENYRIVSGAPVPLREWWISAAIGSR